MKHTKDMVKTALDSLKDQEMSCFDLELTLGAHQITQSKVGGTPYLPQGADLPRTPQGEGLRMIAQLNLEEMPQGNLPIQGGILQFWGLEEENYGADQKNPLAQEKSRVLYYPTLENAWTEEAFQEKFPEYGDGEFFPIPELQSFKISYALGTSKLSTSDFHFNPLFVEKFNALYPDTPIKDYEDLEIPVSDFHLFTTHDQLGHKVLGYPNFTQEDPRIGEYQDYILLFQLDSQCVEDSQFDVMWGDCGIGNWFIHPQDLAKGDFSKVLYHWDCY